MRMSMRLFVRAGWYYIEFYRNKCKALKTKDAKEAQLLYKEIEKEYLRGRLIDLESFKKINLLDFRTSYLQSRHTDGVSEWTIKKDGLSLKLLADVLGDGIQLRTITKQSIDKFKTVCRARGASEITINGYLRHIRSSFTWAVDEKYLTIVPKIRLYRRTDDEKPRVLSPREVKQILRAAFRYDRNLGVRFFVALFTGARRRELCNLTWQAIDFDNGTIRLTGKRRTRIIPMVQPINRILKKYRRDIGLVFDCLHPDTVSHRFHEVALACCIDARLHDLRHTCATYMLKNGVPLEVVQKILGHQAISTTQIYAKVLQDVAQKEMAKLRFI